MAQSDTRSLQAIKLETEQTRANLTETVEQLRSTVSETANDLRGRIRPDAIKAEVSNYVRSRGEQLLDDLSNAARNNLVAVLDDFPIPMPFVITGHNAEFNAISHVALG